jgi:3-hydroxyacyl-CoA dehydrogenase
MLGEKIARDPTDIDLVEIHGYGFPRWRGGLLYWLNSRNAADLSATVRVLRENNIISANDEELLSFA